MPRKPSYDRDDLITRAKDLFWQRGWAGTSLKDLETALHIKPGSFYAAFGSKDALFALALEKYAQDNQDALKRLAQDHGPLEALIRLPRMIIEASAPPAKACMLCKTLLELRAQGHPLADTADQHLLAMELQIAELFLQAQAQDEIDRGRNPRALARKYQSDLMGLRMSAEREGGDAGAIAAEIADAVSALRPQA